MKKLIGNKGFTLVELLAVIVVLAIVMSLAVVAITGVLDNARRATFVSEAKSFLEGARNVVNSDDLISVIDRNNVHHLLACDNDAYKSTTIKLDEIPLQQGGIKSPYGNKYDKLNSYIYVEATRKKDDEGNEIESSPCQYVYSIFLYDGIYAIGEVNRPTEWNSIETGSVKPYSCPEGNDGPPINCKQQPKTTP